MRSLTSPVHNFRLHKTDLVATFDSDGMVTHLFESKLEDRTLTFTEADATSMTDQETQSRWNRISGECTDGMLKGRHLTQRVGIMSYTVAWQNFHPESADVKFPQPSTR